ncbi:hypothetical protein WJX74_009328 [Apatococcus lobatus]|uniref:Dynamin N-terminal domain-containing protein n=1 Tax=Apatococcus lobatus TaxID=904363 RepID=A0AAW1RKU8_9CHLO
MDSIPAGTIVKQPITVRICKSDAPTMEIIDLLGIRSTPPAARAMTEQIVKDYLAEEGTLALCVVDATCPELTSSQGIGFVIDQQKEAHTIVTLTKSDKLDWPDIERQVVRRVFKKTEEAIDNLRAAWPSSTEAHHDQVRLLEASGEEQRTFRSKVFDKIPQNMRQFETALRGNIGIANLIHQIEQLYCNYVKNVWQQRAINIMAGPIAEAQQALNALGTPPGPALSTAQVMEHAASFIDYDRMAQRLQQATLLVEAAIREFLQRTPYIKLLLSGISAAFCRESFMHLHRFQELEQVILAKGLVQLIEPGRIRDQLLQDLLPQLRLIRLDFHQHSSIAASFTRLDEAIRVGIVQHAILPLKNGGFSRCAPAGFQLQETDDYKLKRQKTQGNLANFRAAMDVIVNIDKDMDDPAGGSSDTGQRSRSHGHQADGIGGASRGQEAAEGSQQQQQAPSSGPWGSWQTAASANKNPLCYSLYD